mgnify:CR=1 FL=1
MPQIVINSVTYNDLAQAWPAGVLTAGTYIPTGEPPEYGQPPAEGRPVYDRRRVSFPGLPAVGEKDMGGNAPRSRTLWVDIVIVGTVTTCETARAALLLSLATNTRYTITLPGTTARQGCKLVGDTQPKFFTLEDKVLSCFTLTFEQLSEAN